MCPICGLIPEEEVIQKMEAEQYKPGLSAKINPINKGPLLMQSSRKNRKRNKKLYDELGIEINQDPDIMNDIAQGRIVKYYKETVYDSVFKDDKSKS